MPVANSPPHLFADFAPKNLGIFRFVQVYRELIDSKGVQSHRGSILALKLKASRTDRGPALHDGFQIAHYAGLKISWRRGELEEFEKVGVGVS